MIKRFFSLFILAFFAAFAMAQMLEPVTFSTQITTSGDKGQIVFNGRIAAGWHVYSTDMGDDGPISASLIVNKLDGVQLKGKLKPQGKEISTYDELFDMNVRYFTGSVKFVQEVQFTKPNYALDVCLEYGACNNKNCLPPTQVPFKANGKVVVKEEKKEEPTVTETVADTAKDVSLDVAASDSVTVSSDRITADALWQPVVKELNSQNNASDSNSEGIWYVFVMGLLGGILALFTPCVWPIIPMTVSFFLKRAKDSRTKGVRDALTYGVSIVVIYLALGLAVTALFGANALNALATNAYFNLFFCLLLIVFAVSFFGWFELRLPESWGNAVDSKATRATGILSIFLMAFTLTLVSFSCTGPIIGFLLVDFATSGSILAPAVGMFGFALALAFPFTLFALFPGMLKKAPKSGAWMNTIKVVLGFIELAFSLKFFSVADLAYGWHLLDREVFLALWIVIFGAMGLYLIGKLKFQSDMADGNACKPMPVPCILLGLCSFAFALYMVPGLWGAPCKAVSAFAPPLSTQDFNLYSHEVRPAFTDYEQGMAAAKAQHKPVIIDFTGYGCVNCRKMEAAVWTDTRVAGRLEKDFVLISLFVDDKTPLPEPMKATVAGKERTLHTLGDKWSYLQAMKFGANAQPFYVAVDNNGNPLCGSYSFNEDPDAFLRFLDKGKENYKAE